MYIDFLTVICVWVGIGAVATVLAIKVLEWFDI